MGPKTWNYMRLLVAAFVLWSGFAVDAAKKGVRVGFVVDGEWHLNSRFLDAIQKEMTSLLGKEFKISFADPLIGDWSTKKVRAQLQKLRSDPSIDLILALGIVASHHACGFKAHPKPTFAPFIVDPKMQNCPQKKKGRGTGVKNFNYTHALASFRDEIKLFYQMAGFKNLVVLTSPIYVKAIPGFRPFFEDLGHQLGISIDVMGVDTADAQTLQKFPAKTEAVYFGPILTLPPKEFKDLIQRVHKKHWLSFSSMGRQGVEAGLLAGMATDSQHTWRLRLSRRLALFAQRALLGENLANLKTDFRNSRRLLINMGTAVELRYSPRWEILREAEVFNTKPHQTVQTFSLGSVLKEAERQNLRLLSKTRDSVAAENAVGAASAKLLPQLETSLTGRIIDEDRAEASLGTQPQRQLEGTIELTQVLFSDQAWSGRAIEKRRARVTQSERAALRLDILFESGKAYLNILKLGHLVSIQENYLKLSRSNLEIAKVRERVGTAGPAEAYRWRSEVARTQKQLIEVSTQQRLAKIHLNTLLNRESESPFETLSVSLEDPDFILGDRRIFAYLDNPWHFEIFRGFMVQEALNHSPNMKAVSEAVAIQQTVLNTNRRSFVLPTLGLFGKYTHQIAKGGTGSSSPSLVPNLTLPQADDHSWAVGLKLSLPLFLGGERIAKTRSAGEKLTALKLKEASIRQGIEQQMRSGLFKTRAKWESIVLSKRAAEAASKNYELVKKAYARGVLPITQLLDAQSASMASEQAASVSIYDFLIEFLDVQRTSGGFDLMKVTEDKGAFFERLDRYFTKRLGDSK